MGISLVSSSRQQIHSSRSLLRNNGPSGPLHTVPSFMDGPDPARHDADNNVERDENGNPTVIGSRINEFATSRYSLF